MAIMVPDLRTEAKVMQGDPGAVGGNADIEDEFLFIERSGDAANAADVEISAAPEIVGG